MLNAQDNGEPGRTCSTATASVSADTFRIQITGPTGGAETTSTSGAATVYDNFQSTSASESTSSLTSYSGTCIAGGSIKIHTQKRRVLRGDSSVDI